MQDHVQGSAHLPAQVASDINYLFILLKVGMELVCSWNLLAPCVSNSPMGLELSQIPSELMAFWEGSSGEGSGAAPLPTSLRAGFHLPHLISRWLFLFLCFSSMQFPFKLFFFPLFFFFSFCIILSIQFRELARHPLGLGHTVFVQLLLSEVFFRETLWVWGFFFSKVTYFKKTFIC